MSTKFAKTKSFNFMFLLLTVIFLLSSNSTYGKDANEKKQNAEQISEQTPESSELDGNQNISLSTDSTVTASLKAIIKPIKSKTEVELNSRFYISLALDLWMIFLIIGLIYYRNYKKLDTIFTFVLFNVSIFLLTFLLNQVRISMGAALGLFAVFSMLRYRNEGINAKDMTYMFIFIAMGILSGIQLDLIDLLIVFSILFILILLLDTKILIKRELKKVVHFEDMSLIHVEKKLELIQELNKRTGLNIHRICVNEISYLSSCAIITVYYYE